MSVNTKHLIDILALNRDIQYLHTFEFSFKNKFQDIFDDLTEHEKCIIAICSKIKQDQQCSFWEAILILMQSGEIIPERMLSHITYHNKNKDVTVHTVKQFVSLIESDISDNIALNSKVILIDGQEKHIPMLDFKITNTPNNVKLAIKIVEIMGLHGFILNSGKSFHFIGNKLIEEIALIDLLAKFSLFHPISDKAWTAHQIIERSASLRISMKHNIYPTIICEI